MARFTTTEFSLNTSDVSFEEDIIENFDYTVRSPPPLFTADTSEKKGHTAERLVISDTARKTCETILSGFEMDTSEHILMNGDIAMDFYCYTAQSRKMKHDPNGFCGPNNWTNCAACRVFTRIRNNENGSTPIPKLQKCLQKGKWQGLSGLFYCGKKDNRSATDLNRMKSDGVCVPDTGIPCTECGKELYNA